MKTNFLRFSLLAFILFIASCSNDDKEDTVAEVETQTFSNLDATSSSDFTKFSFSKNAVVTDDSWDIAFKGTTILVNGGTKIGITGEPDRTGAAAVSIVSGTFAEVKEFPLASTFAQDAQGVYAIPTGSGNGWYSYNSSTHLISPIAGKVFVVKTHDGKYAKFEILSYYKDAPLTPDPLDSASTRYYTFKFAYQANSTTTF
ncbi:HmuY family protein [Flavobacterium flavipallidum]|uniref:HmuY family protein n=1 Tax=Flavobacterium flavipallidum TaxID=3139140 RepID=A0ABU9HML9_9FLAO